jgi:RNA methyltransferase, TrmH family
VTPSETHELVARFVAARRDRRVAVLEGYHAVKHALRFGATLEEAVVLTGTPSTELPAELTAAGTHVRSVEEELFDRLLPARPPLPLIALAPRRIVAPDVVVGTGGQPGRAGGSGRGPVVVLEDPTHHGNVGAAVRVAAAAGARGLLVVGQLDPWHPSAIRGGAGLQYALSVTGSASVPASPRPLVAFDPDGTDLREVTAPEDALIVFGSERRGLSDEVRARADVLVRIPMRERVSSLNLATSVAVALYAFAGPNVAPT